MAETSLKHNIHDTTFYTYKYSGDTILEMIETHIDDSVRLFRTTYNYNKKGFKILVNRYKNLDIIKKTEYEYRDSLLVLKKVSEPVMGILEELARMNYGYDEKRRLNYEVTLIHATEFEESRRATHTIYYNHEGYMSKEEYDFKRFPPYHLQYLYEYW